MLVSNHIKINLILALILLLFLHWFYVLIFLLSTILIDFDHYPYYVFEKKRFSLKKAYRWYITERERFHNLSLEERKKHRYFILIFHGIESLLILLLLSNYYPPVYFIFAGFTVHLAEDLVIASKYQYAERKLSLIYAIYLHTKKQSEIN